MLFLYRYSKYISALCVFILFACKVQALPVPVKYLGIEQGLSNNTVICLTQDQYGFMWIGTYDGLNRYDGNQFKNFRNVWGDSSSLISNHIKTLGAVGDRIFVGTQRGLMYYNYADLKFHALYYRQNNTKKAVKVTSSINQILTDGLGNTYVATEMSGLLIYKKNENVGRQVLIKARVNIKMGNSVQALTTDAKKQLWLYVNGIGLCRYNTAKNEIILMSKAPASSSCLMADARDNIWIGTNNGPFIWQNHNKKLIKFTAPGQALSSNSISYLSLSREDGKVWIATNGGGVNIWDSQTQKLSYIAYGDTKYSLHSSAVAEIYVDNEQRKWIATLRGGVNIIDNNIAPFKTYTHDRLSNNSVIDNFILSFCEDEHKNIWIGTDGGGLSYWNTKINIYNHYVSQPGPGHLGSNFVVSILKDHKNQIWVATFNGGIDVFDKVSGKFKHYVCYNPNSKYEERYPWKIYEDKEHRIWVSNTWGGALYLYNSLQDKFELFDPKLVNVHAIYQDHSGALWAGDYRKLIKIDVQRKQHKYFVIGQAIRSIIEDNSHHLWVGTEGGGLLDFDRLKNTYKRYTQTDGLSSNSILNILVDRKNNLWFSTYNGLSMFAADRKKFTNYYASDGLQSNQFSYNAALKLSSGRMLFGGIKGFNMFNPDSISSSVHEPTLQLTDFRINNKSIEENEAYGQNKPLYALKEITIPYNEAIIALGYTALEYSFPEKIKYAYYLEGWDHNWNYVGKLKSAYYTRLHEGHYTLKIKSTNTDGVWNEKSLIVIQIIVLPPWYRTWWAYLLYVTAIGTVVYGFGLYRKKQLELKYEVQIANLKIEKEKEANEKKLSFFTNVSHEFRTPLTLIINPIKDMLNQSKGNNEELNIVYRNARRLLGLVDHLLLFRKTESENAELKISRINFHNLCKDVYTCFLHQAKIKNIEYTFGCTCEQIELYADREKIEIALFNLISNAVKFTPNGGSIHIHIKELEETVCFEIVDSGIGISADVGEKLFNKFYQVKGSNSLKTGFGIGLYLVKTFIEDHQGTVNYHNTAGGGATFTLSLPKGKQYRATGLAAADNESTMPAQELIDHDNVESATGQERSSNNLELLISNSQSILIIDDNPEILKYTKTIFASDYTVYEANNGELGLELIRKHLPDVIISDIVMPGLDGLQLCKIIKEDTATSHIPIILLTGESTPDIRLKGIEEGAVDFISKPFDKELLIARVKGIIKNKTELQNYFYSEITLKGKTHNISEEHKDFLYKCIGIIEASLTDTSFEVSSISEKLGISYSTLYKKIRAITGVSINGFIRFVRLRKAAELMINTNCNVNEAAFNVGFNDMKYFREHFNKQFGLNPSDFIKRHRTAFQKSYNFRAIKDLPRQSY